MTSDQITQLNAALKVFFTAVHEWALTEDQASTLLDISPSVYQQYKNGVMEDASQELYERLALVSLIYGSLKQLYSDKNIGLWLKNPSQKDSPWKGVSPLDTMLTDHTGLVLVHTYLSQQKGDG